MKIFKHIAPLKAHLKQLSRQAKTIGLVPTMGALHKGHLALLKASQLHNDITVSTIFVNPTQFNNPADLAKYPRSLDKDTRMLEEVQCDVLFCPETAELYPEKSTVKFDFGQLDKIMEGFYRPGHFSGVALIVSKLFNIVEPDRAYFGQKDWQQFAIIRQLVEELNFPVMLHSVPTLREDDGLAFSSRNARLNAEERKHATVFYHALTAAREQLRKGGKIGDAKKTVKDIFERKPGASLEYFEVADRKNLNALENVEAADDAILCIAGYIGEIRLIDNIFLSS